MRNWKIRVWFGKILSFAGVNIIAVTYQVYGMHLTKTQLKNLMQLETAEF